MQGMHVVWMWKDVSRHFQLTVGTESRWDFSDFYFILSLFQMNLIYKQMWQVLFHFSSFLCHESFYLSFHLYEMEITAQFNESLVAFHMNYTIILSIQCMHQRRTHILLFISWHEELRVVDYRNMVFRLNKIWFLCFYIHFIIYVYDFSSLFTWFIHFPFACVFIDAIKLKWY